MEDRIITRQAVLMKKSLNNDLLMSHTLLKEHPEKKWCWWLCAHINVFGPSNILKGHSFITDI